MGLYCGVDLHSNNGVYAVLDETDRQVFKKRLPNDLPKVLEALAPFKTDLKGVAVESTFNWYWLVDGLQDSGYPVRLANPAAMEQYDGLKDANDDTDAVFLAQMLRLGILPEGYIYPKQERPVRDLLRRRMLLVQTRTSIELSLRSLMTRQTGKNPGWRELRRHEPSYFRHMLGGDEVLVFTVEQQMGLIRFLTEKIRLFEKQVLERAQLKPEYRLLLSMPGVGMILALTIMLETGDIGRFPGVANFSSYCRAAKARRLSNGKCKGDNNGKCGNAYLSWAFVEAVHHALRLCEPARKFYQRKSARRNEALAVKALASKWSKAAYYVMKRQEPFDLKRVFG